MQDIVFLLKDEKVKQPRFKPFSTTFDLRVHSFQKVFNGIKDVNLNKELQNSLEQGFITLRGHERVKIGTGLHVSLPLGIQLNIVSHPDIAINKGITVASTINCSEFGEEEICVVAFNTGPFLCTIKLDSIIAQAYFTELPTKELNIDCNYLNK